MRTVVAKHTIGNGIIYSLVQAMMLRELIFYAFTKCLKEVIKSVGVSSVVGNLDLKILADAL